MLRVQNGIPPASDADQAECRLRATSQLISAANSTISLDHLVSTGQECLRHRKAQRFGGLEVDYQFKLGRLLDRDIGRLGAAQELDELPGHLLSKHLDDARAVGDKTPFLRLFRKLINGRQAQRRDVLHNNLATGVEGG